MRYSFAVILADATIVQGTAGIDADGRGQSGDWEVTRVTKTEEPTWDFEDANIITAWLVGRCSELSHAIDQQLEQLGFFPTVIHAIRVQLVLNSRKRKAPPMRYAFSVTLYDDTLILGVATVEAVEGGHEGLIVGNWELSTVMEPGEPGLHVEVGDGDAIVRWVASRHAELDFEIVQHFETTLDPFEVANDERVLRNEMQREAAIDAEIDERESRVRVLH